MKNNYIYTIFFVFLISAVFTAILASVNAFYTPVIRENEQVAKTVSILSSLGFDNIENNKDINRLFEENIEQEERFGTVVYTQYNDEQKPIAYAIEFIGSGLWGSINGYLGVSADLNEIVGIDFTSHSETPGLGGRIDEQWYKDQFVGIKVTDPFYIKNKVDGDGDVDAITGATLTSNSVVSIINEAIEKIQKQEEA